MTIQASPEFERGRVPIGCPLVEVAPGRSQIVDEETGTTIDVNSSPNKVGSVACGLIIERLADGQRWVTCRVAGCVVGSRDISVQAHTPPQGIPKIPLQD